MLKLKKPARTTTYIIVILCLIIGSFLFAKYGVSDKYAKYKEEAIEECVKLCKLEHSKGSVLLSGPCLSNEIAPAWSCDVVTQPKNSFIDDLSENKCAKKTKHIVEVSPECEIVRSE